MNGKKIATILFKYRNQFFFVSLFFLLISIFSITKIEIDGDLTGNIVKNSSFYQAGEKIRNVFNISNPLKLKIKPKSGATLLSLEEAINDLVFEIKTSYPEIKVSSIFDFKEYFEIEKIDRNASALDSFKKIKEIAIVKNFISNDIESMQIVFDVPDSFNFHQFDEIIASWEDKFDTIIPFSRFHVEGFIENLIEKDIVVLSMIIILLAFIIIFFVFRQLSYILVCILFLVAGMLPAAFSFMIFNVNINIVTILVIPILIVLTLSNVVHLLSGICFSGVVQAEDRTINSIGSYVVPSFFASFTTAIAFVSFSFSSVQNMYQFSLVSSLSVILAFIVIYGMAPAVLFNCIRFLKLKRRGESGDRILNLVIKFLNHSKMYILILLLCFSYGIFKINTVEFKTDSSLFFPKGSVIYDIHEEFRKDFSSLFSLDILVKGSDHPKLPIEYKWDTTEIPKSIYLLTKKIERLNGVQNVSSLGGVIEYFYDRGYTSDSWDTQKYSNPLEKDGKHLVRVWFENADDAIDVYKPIVSILDGFKRDISYEVSSIILLNNETNILLAKSIFKSLLISLVLIFLVIYLISRSLMVTWGCLLVNIIPLSVISSIIHFFEFKLNIITAMSSVICLGIIVDDTIHVIYRWKEKKPLKNLFYGMMVTSVILSLGFGVLSFSQFEPSRVFGVICGVVFILALVVDIIFLPMFLELVNLRRKEHVS